MLAVAHATPHYRAVSAWQRLVFDGEGLGAIALSLLVLAAAGGALVGLAAAVLRRDLTA